MTIIYDVVAKRHKGSSQPDTCLFYDYDRDEAIKYMGKYDKEHGFTIDEKGKSYAIADIVLRERTSTGEKLNEIPYHELFNMVRQGNGGLNVDKSKRKTT